MPKLGLLHGFLGQKEDWDPLLRFLPDHWDIQAIDLPFHASRPPACDIPLAAHQTLQTADFLIGYSAGGRLALELKYRFPKSYGSVVALCAHPGLKNQKERKARRERDEKWAKLLQTTSLSTFLDKWYKQELFASFRSHPDFSRTLENRKRQNPKHMAAFLKQFSLGHQPYREHSLETIFLCGKEDLKYQMLYRKLEHFYKIYPIESASHAVHLENPEAVAKVLEEIVDEH